MFSSFTQIGSYNDQQICRAQLGPRQLRSHAIALLPLDYATKAYSKLHDQLHRGQRHAKIALSS